MTTSRRILCWLLCGLLLFAGVPLRAASPCDAAVTRGGPAAIDAGVADPGCCSPEGCCCPPVQTRECGCGAPVPQPLPTPSAEKHLLVQAGEDRSPDRAAQPTQVAPRLSLATASRLPAVMLPQTSRQEALAVWRL